MIHQGTINIVGWILVAAAIIGLAGAGSGVAYAALRPRATAVSDMRAEGHDTYYVVCRDKAAIWPLLLCIALLSAVGIIGYTLTDLCANRLLQQFATK